MERKPNYLNDTDERTHTPTDEPLWSESYLIQAYDPDAGVGFFTHVNRTEWDVELWNDVFVVYLPDDNFVVAKGFGLGDEEGPSGGGTSMRPVTPWQTIQLTHRSGALQTDGRAARASGITDARHVALNADLTFEGHGPAFDLGNIDEPPVGHAHYEQHGHITGTVSYGDTSLAFNGTGLRDHTWGPRDLGFLGRHVWHHGLFPSGRWFSLAEVRDPSDENVMIQICRHGNADSIADSRLLSAPAFLNTEDDAWNSFDLELEVTGGTPAKIHGEVIAPFPFSWSGVNEMVLGADRRTNPSHRYFETMTRLEWDGETGYGLTERTVKL
jgi:hypothetical protein